MSGVRSGAAAHWSSPRNSGLLAPRGTNFCLPVSRHSFFLSRLHHNTTYSKACLNLCAQQLKAPGCGSSQAVPRAWAKSSRLLQRGDKVIATARSAAKLSELVEAGAHALQLDVTSPLAELEALADQAVGVYGRVDLIINNAAYVFQGAIEASRSVITSPVCVNGVHHLHHN